MCTRILNNINRNHVTVGRNMDWEFPLEPTVVYTPASGERFGMSVREVKKVNDKSPTIPLEKDNVLAWDIKYASLSTMIGNESDGYGFCDGMNDQGLVANALYDTNCSFGVNQNEKQKGLSILRWGQYILDSFANVQQAVSSLSDPKIYLYGGLVPGDDFSPATLHIAISDRNGNSAILEVHNSEIKIYENDNYTVMTNQPDYPTQLKMMDYWLFQWNKPDIFNSTDEHSALAENHIRNPHPVFSVPGGYTSVQRFERACFYRYMYNQQASGVDPVAQVRSMVATCNVPQAFEELYPHNLLEKIEKRLGYSVNSYTLWTNISDSKQLRYYLMDNLSVQSLWFDFNPPRSECYALVVDKSLKNSGIMGLANSAMKTRIAPPFSDYK
ncbi:linear amide C-N hydrolase [Vibrio sp. 99-70-13A1]|uniref:linear amide C-N hydrolase n=1 Tax=Vibrio sp. 99-70-13A1 TaxID=2607601 RepID=UPI001493C1FE|nr:linear amide C-N hydrolase [Vibrio sp. 99-70-13A1]NOH95794.1 linear amide C-N hydrolase [Vibrio sp. 99-70-13A1]